MVVDIKLTHPDVNGGDAVELQGVKVTYAWGNLVQGKPIIGIGDIAEKGQNGFENPIININGVWDIDDQTDLNTPADGLICQKLLVDFSTLRSTTPMTLSIHAGENQTELGGRPSGGYSSGANTLSTTISVTIKEFKIMFGTGIKEGQRWDYSITLVETY